MNRKILARRTLLKKKTIKRNEDRVFDDIFTFLYVYLDYSRAGTCCISTLKKTYFNNSEKIPLMLLNAFYYAYFKLEKNASGRYIIPGENERIPSYLEITQEKLSPALAPFCKYISSRFPALWKTRLLFLGNKDVITLVTMASNFIENCKYGSTIVEVPPLPRIKGNRDFSCTIGTPWNGPIGFQCVNQLLLAKETHPQPNQVGSFKLTVVSSHNFGESRSGNDLIPLDIELPQSVEDLFE